MRGIKGGGFYPTEGKMVISFLGGGEA